MGEEQVSTCQCVAREARTAEGVHRMTRDTLRTMARNRWPVVLCETGAHGEITYPYIREIKVIYASGDELSRGYPLERLAVVLADRSGHSFTEVRAA